MLFLLIIWILIAQHHGESSSYLQEAPLDHALKAAIHHAHLASHHANNETGKLPSRSQMQRAIYMGDDERLRNALTKAYSGQPIKISIIGGSTSFGLGAGKLGDRYPIYADRLVAWAKEAWPRASVTVVNGAFPAVNSLYMSSCVNLHSPSDSDIVIIELAANDNPAYQEWNSISSGQNNAGRDKLAFERLVRKLLSRPSRPAILLLDTFQHPNNMPNPTMREQLYFSNAEVMLLVNLFQIVSSVLHASSLIPFLAQAFYFDIATFYGLTLLSLKAAVFPQIHQQLRGFLLNSTQHQFMMKDGVLSPDIPGFNEGYSYLFWDNMHLSSYTGHRVLADLVITVLLKASRKLVNLEQGGGYDEMTTLPPPVFKDNFQAERESCILGPQLKNAEVSRNGFEWINDQKDPTKPPKWGWTAYEPNSEIALKISTLDALNSSNSLVSLSIGYLRSYEQMGNFKVSCPSLSCSCSSQIFTGHDSTRKVSQMAIGSMRVSTDANCIVKIQSLNETMSGKHKVKIKALVIGESKHQGALSDNLSEQLQGSMEKIAQFQPGG